MATSSLMIQTSALKGFTELVTEYQYDPEVLLSPYNVDKSKISNSDSRIPVDHFAAILHSASRALDAPDFGLKLGCMQDFSVLGDLGFCYNIREH